MFCQSVVKLVCYLLHNLVFSIIAQTIDDLISYKLFPTDDNAVIFTDFLWSVIAAIPDVSVWARKMVLWLFTKLNRPSLR